MVQNTPTGCVNNLPVLLRSYIFAKIEKDQSRITDPDLGVALGVARRICQKLSRITDRSRGSPWIRRVLSGLRRRVASKSCV